MTTQDDRCFCDLVPLAALEVLDDAEQAWVDGEIAALPELEEELADFQRIVGALAYSAPAAPMAEDLKERLFQRLNLAPSTPAEMAATSNEPVSPEIRSPEPLGPFLAVRSQDLQWKPYRVPGVSVARLSVDRSRREVSAILRADPGVCYPLHVHAGFEEIYMLEGDLRIGNQIYHAGDYIRSEPGSSHQPTTQTGCLFFVRTSLEDEYPEEALEG